MHRAYGLQFHVEIDATLATEWGTVPAYAQSLQMTLGPDGLRRLISEIRSNERQMTGLARRLFAAWLEHVVGLPQSSRRNAR